MAARFKTGVPRRGQWVLIDGELLGIAVECNLVNEKTGESLYGTMKGVITRFPYPHAPETLAAIRDTSAFRVDIPHAKTGMDTVGSLMVPLSALEPLLDITRIPEERRSKLAEGWVLRP